MTAPERSNVAPANPSLWCESSQRQVVSEWTEEYRDIRYACWRCKAESVFTAQDQKYTYEVQKAPIDQRRSLCNGCWRESLEVLRALEALDARWKVEKNVLRGDKIFLSDWLKLLELREQFRAHRADVGKKNMLNKLLADA